MYDEVTSAATIGRAQRLQAVVQPSKPRSIRQWHAECWIAGILIT